MEKAPEAPMKKKMFRNPPTSFRTTFICLWIVLLCFQRFSCSQDMFQTNQINFPFLFLCRTCFFVDIFPVHIFFLVLAINSLNNSHFLRYLCHFFRRMVPLGCFLFQVKELSREGPKNKWCWGSNRHEDVINFLERKKINPDKTSVLIGNCPPQWKFSGNLLSQCPEKNQKYNNSLDKRMAANVKNKRFVDRSCASPPIETQRQHFW